MYNPKGYNMYALPNVYDKFNQGKPDFVFFFPGYINRKGCYNKDGVSDVIKALIQVLMNRYRVKYNSTDPNTIMKTIAEIPITPAEAIIKTSINIFPVADLTERLGQLDANPDEYNDVYVGELIINNNNEVEFKPTSDEVIRTFPHKNNKLDGALEIFKMPEKDKAGNVFKGRYIGGNDPFDDDTSNTMSLGSLFILDLWTDTIVAEYTGRPMIADTSYEIWRRMALFYNAVINYEAHPYDQEIRLPDGSVKLWKDIQIGDTLLAPDSTVVRVTGIPMDGEDDIYRITLEDGRQVEASGWHIWKVRKSGYSDYRELHTVNMLDNLLNSRGNYNFFIPESGIIEYSFKEVPVDPYAVGLSLVYGSYVKSMEKELYDWNLLKKDTVEKSISALYLFNDYNIRLELLRGLMDGDGYTNRKGINVFNTSFKGLAEDVTVLCRSLGMKVKMVKDRKITGRKHYIEFYRLMICTDIPIFKSPRKVIDQHLYSLNVHKDMIKKMLKDTAIINIEYVGKKKCKCVTVSNSDGLYLIGDFITTHNCNKKGFFSYMASRHCLHLLADTLDYLRDKDMIKGQLIGNKSKGVNANQAINNLGRNLLRSWLLSPITVIRKVDEEQKEITVPRLYTLRNRALIQELINYNSSGNFDRISAMGMLMLYREDKMILYNGNLSGSKDTIDSSYIGNDPFFKDNFESKLPSEKY